jgi:hypothetical protein
MSNVICLEEQRIRRKIRKFEKKLYDVRALISHGDYDRVGEAMELEAVLATLENSLILLIEHEFEEFLPAPPEE